MKTSRSKLKRLATNNWLLGTVAFGCLMTNHPTALVAVCSAIVVNLVLSARGENFSHAEDEPEFGSFGLAQHAGQELEPGPGDVYNKDDGLFMHELNDLSKL
jgi:hypothetical protein